MATKTRTRRRRRIYHARKGGYRFRAGQAFRLRRYGRRTIRILRVRPGSFRPIKYGLPFSGRIGNQRIRAKVYRHRRGKWRGSRRVSFTNPKRRGRGRRRNPGIVADYAGGLMAAPKSVMASLKGGNMVKNVGFLAGGTVATYVAGGMVTRLVAPMLAKLPGIGPVLASDMPKRILSGLMPYTLGFAASKMVKDAGMKSALLTGGAVAALLGVVAPKALDGILSKLGLAKLTGVSGIGTYQALAGYFGDDTLLAGYVNAPGYQGVGAYVNAPGYAGVGDNTPLAGYVQAPSYAGVQGYLDAGYLDRGYLSMESAVTAEAAPAALPAPVPAQ
jgi:hypothetical protein